MSKFSQINKLYNKLQSIKINFELKRKRKNNNNKIFVKQNKDFFDTNQNEINICKILMNNNSFSNETKNKMKLKNLLNLILNKEYIKENNINNCNINSNKTNKISGVSKTLNCQKEIRTIKFQKNQQNQSNIAHLNLKNSFSCDISNDKPDIYNESNFKTHIFSPFIRINNLKPNTIDRIKTNSYNKI